MSELYPPIEPYDHGWLPVGDGHRVYWETCGNPEGKPALVVHGGPGSGCGPRVRRFFDPARYRIILFDQRNAGRSTPHASEPEVDLSANTTEHLLADMEALREALGVQRWQLFGGSWGSVLSLVYALRHPGRVSELVLMGLASGRRAETDLLTRGLGVYFPEAWRAFRNAVPAAERDGDLPSAYDRLLHDPDPRVREAAARAWCDWEEAIDVGGPAGTSRYEDPDFRLAFARIVTHYWSRGCWLPEGEVLRRASELADIPGVVVQGSLDPGNLLGTVWELAHRWGPACELRVVGTAGHSTAGEGMAARLVAATDRFADGATTTR
ncbi:proline iminopeptidase [Streptomyces zhaozhouensis]|uniref:Proline iminopeptidase n=1 Tax=Streptomyces zhaozhouensis TaxID=1300267 RepID=A0A286DST0_9ACTN|nr:prolyl aminopeptidase [Streptomyces zhaozhouensis]SOD61747.1 proline iminopeptidase [Streptomyces zhaozhouensis]